MLKPVVCTRCLKTISQGKKAAVLYTILDSFSKESIFSAPGVILQPECIQLLQTDFTFYAATSGQVRIAERPKHAEFSYAEYSLFK